MLLNLFFTWSFRCNFNYILFIFLYQVFLISVPKLNTSPAENDVPGSFVLGFFIRHWKYLFSLVEYILQPCIFFIFPHSPQIILNIWYLLQSWFKFMIYRGICHQQFIKLSFSYWVSLFQFFYQYLIIVGITFVWVTGLPGLFENLWYLQILFRLNLECKSREGIPMVFCQPRIDECRIVI